MTADLFGVLVGGGRIADHLNGIEKNRRNRPMARSYPPNALSGNNLLTNHDDAREINNKKIAARNNRQLARPPE